MLSLASLFKVGTTLMDARLLDILACPICRGKLVYNHDTEELICKLDRLAFKIQDDVPVMLENEARQLSEEELHGV